MHVTRFIHMHSGGRATGVINGDKNVYVDNAIPGEVAEVTVLRRLRGYRQGVIDRLLQTVADRVPPFCPHALICGGCNWQHIAYPAQLMWKRQILVDALVKYGIRTPPVPEVHPAPLLQGYRNKCEYACIEGILGFHPAGNPHKVFACDSCFLQPPHVHPIAKSVASIVGTQLQALQIRTTTLGDTFCLITSTDMDEAVQQRLQVEIPQVNGWYYRVNENCIHFGGAVELTEKMDHFYFKYGALSFFQPNPLQAVALYRQVSDYAQLTGIETIYDLYTGVGTIACFIAAGAKEVIGIEGNGAAILEAQRNALYNNIYHAQFITGDILKTFTSGFVDLHPQAHLIILDPPRSGTLIEIKKAILYAAPQKIIYVSCNPVSLAWDLVQLCKGGYNVTAIQPFDMFPHTHHVETVCLLER